MTVTIEELAKLTKLLGAFQATKGRPPTLAEVCSAMAWDVTDGPARLNAARRSLAPRNRQPASATPTARPSPKVATPLPMADAPPKSLQRAQDASGPWPRRPRVFNAEEAGKVVHLVDEYWRLRGRGPTWAGLSAALGWDRDQGARKIAAMIRAGRLRLDQLSADPDAADRRVRRWLEERGITPTPAAIAERHRAVEEARSAGKRNQALIATAVEADRAKATQWVRAYRGTHGRGPHWSELGEAMGWPGHLRAAIVRRLAHAGHLAYQEGVERSLDVGAGGGG
jgi:hypothetical protein